jgi:hypothetical protein
VFPGAASGFYNFEVSGSEGNIECLTADIFIQTKLEVTEFTPRSGSTLGGTLVTITGEHFGTTDTDNPVKIGDNYCYVLTTGDTEITCRIGDLTDQSADANALLLVFARVTEEMVCSTSDDCLFEYAAPTSTITGILSTIDVATNSLLVEITGSDLGTDASKVELYIDDFAQIVISAADDSVMFQV